MTVHVELLGPMRRPWRERERDVEVSDGSTVAELLAELGYSDDESRFFSVVLNGARVRGNPPLAQGDRVTLTLVVGGG